MLLSQNSDLFCKGVNLQDILRVTINAGEFFLILTNILSTSLYLRTVFLSTSSPRLSSPAHIPLILPQNGWLLSFFCLPMLSWEIRAIRLGVLLTCRQRRECGQLGIVRSSSTFPNVFLHFSLFVKLFLQMYYDFYMIP